MAIGKKTGGRDFLPGNNFGKDHLGNNLMDIHNNSLPGNKIRHRNRRNNHYYCWDNNPDNSVRKSMLQKTPRVQKVFFSFYLNCI